MNKETKPDNSHHQPLAYNTPSLNDQYDEVRALFENTPKHALFDALLHFAASGKEANMMNGSALEIAKHRIDLIKGARK